MHFTTLLAASAAVSGALAGVYYEESSYTTVEDKVYTSVKTCTDKPTTTAEPVYEPATTDYPVSEVTYTSYEKITVTSCGDYVTSCPAETYTSTAYSVSTCTKGYVPSEYPVPTESEYYVPPANTTDYYVPPVEYPTETTEVPYPTETAYPTETPATYTHTYYTTVCPGKDYCYATTVTSTYCPGTETPSYTKTYVPPAETTPYVPEKPTYVPVPVCPGGYDCPTPPKNETTPTYSPPPSYTGAASANAVSFGVAAVAGLAALFIAA